MEVHVTNVPQQTNDKALRNFLKTHLTLLNIRNFHCYKTKGKRFASLTFLNIDEGQRFLGRHSQTASTNRRGFNRASNLPNGKKSDALIFYGSEIYFSKSFRDPNPHLLRTLAREAKERDNQGSANHPEHPLSNKFVPLEFQCLGVSCGVWSPEGPEVTFVPQLSWNEEAAAVFGERVVKLTMSSGLRIDFRYSSMLEITTEDNKNPAITLTMYEAPRFFENIQDPVAELTSQLALLSYKPQAYVPSKNGPTRHRLPCLNSEHKIIAGSCLVYRIMLRQHQYTQFGVLMEDVGETMEAFGKAPGIFVPVLHQRVPVREPLETHAIGVRRLRNVLLSLNCDLPFVLKFQVEKLVQGGYLSPFMVLDLLPEFSNMIRRSTPPVCVHALRKFMNKIPFVRPETDVADFDLDTLIDLLQEVEEQAENEAKSGYEESRRSENVAIIHRAKITPTGIQLSGPEPESNNRVLRKHPDHHEYFLRVQFCDEDSQPVRFNPRISNERIFHGRFKEVLSTGISIADRVYKFLGFSHSSLRAQSCWFVAPFIYKGTLTHGPMIINDLGNFSVIRCPAKCAARIGQAFSDTRTAVGIDLNAIKLEKDVQRNGRVFSDGVGRMSTVMMEKVHEKLPKKALVKPTCFQIRFQGAKGMISLDSCLEGDTLVLRESMIKFQGSNSRDIEICEAAYKPLPMFLNRQFIKILEDMGVEDDFFLSLQAAEVKRLRMITNNPPNAAKFLTHQSVGEAIHLPWLITELAMLNLDFRSDRFLRDVVELAVLLELRKLKHKTRIPVEKGYHLHGLMDETGFLKEGQVFCTVLEDGTPKYITGKNIIISRAPALHPGDVQLVDAVMPPKGSPLMKLSNCICFSQNGNRDLPSKLSGGDLDGDRYYIMWDERAKPKHFFTPADYPRQNPVDIGRPVQPSDMTSFFIQFMETDQLGRIAVLHRVLADQQDGGTLAPECITLAEMHSTAVDFSKTGIPVDMSKLPRSSPWRPDFEAPGPHVKIEKSDGISLAPSTYIDPLDEEDQDDEFTRYRYYESRKILGKLYRAIDEKEIFEHIQKSSQAQGAIHRSSLIDEVWKYVRNKVQSIQWEYQIDWAHDTRDMYEDCLMNIMVEYSEHPSRPLSELEVFVGDILGRTGVQNRHQRELSKTMKERFEEDTAFIVNCILKDGEEWSDEALERSIACLFVSLEDTTASKRHGNLLSFNYVAAAVCLREVQKLPGWEILPHLDIF